MYSDKVYSLDKIASAQRNISCKRRDNILPMTWKSESYTNALTDISNQGSKYETSLKNIQLSVGSYNLVRWIGSQLECYADFKFHKHTFRNLTSSR